MRWLESFPGPTGIPGPTGTPVVLGRVISNPRQCHVLRTLSSSNGGDDFRWSLMAVGYCSVIDFLMTRGFVYCRVCACEWCGDTCDFCCSPRCCHTRMSYRRSHDLTSCIIYQHWVNQSLHKPSCWTMPQGVPLLNTLDGLNQGSRVGTPAIKLLWVYHDRGNIKISSCRNTFGINDAFACRMYWEK